MIAHHVRSRRAIPALPQLCVLVCGLCTGDARSLWADSRTSFVIAQLTAHNSGLSAAVLREKYTAMSASAAAFYRGTAHLYWADFGASPLLAMFGSSTTHIWLQGDDHTANQGAFDNSAGTVCYDLNDFDEAVIGDYKLDLFRLATSVVLVARENGGFSDSEIGTALDSCSNSYLDTLDGYAGNDGERSDASLLTAKTAYGRLDEFLDDTEAKDSRKALLDKYTVVSRGARVFSSTSSDLQAVSVATAQALTDALPAYGATLSGGLRYSPSYFKVKSVAQRLHAGLGSLGTPRYYILIDGATTSGDDDRILDVKAEGLPSAFATLASTDRALTDSASGGNPARRAVLGTRALGYRVDNHLGTLQTLGRDFLVRERSPYKETFDTTELTSETRLTKLAAQWCTTLATAHARADRDFNAAIIPVNFEQEVLGLVAGKKSQFRTYVRQTAMDYAAQAEADYQIFMNWYKP